MEFVGRKVRKELREYGMHVGTVRSYNEDSGFFEIVYEDGNSEELELSGILPFVSDFNEVSNDDGDDVEPSAKKQRSLEVDPSASSNFDSSELDLNEDGGLDLNSNEHFSVSLSEEIDVKCGENKEQDLNNAKEHFSVSLNEGVDVTCGENKEQDLNNAKEHFSVSLNEGVDVKCGENKEQDLNNGVGNDENGINCFVLVSDGVKGRGDFIDLNLDVTEAENLDEKLEIDRKNHSFDLNLGFEEENKACLSGNGEGLCAGSTFEGDEKAEEPVEKEEANVCNRSNDVLDGVQSEEKMCEGPVRDEVNDANLSEVGLNASFNNDVGSTGLALGATSISGSSQEMRIDLASMCISGSLAEGTPDPDSTSVSGAAPKGRRGRKKKIVIDIASNVGTCVSGNAEQRTPDPNSTSPSGTAPKGRRGRKRKVVIDSPSNADMNITSFSGSAAKGFDVAGTSVSGSVLTGRFDPGGTSVSGSTSEGRLDPNSTSVSDSAPVENRGRKRKVIMDSASNAAIGTVLRRSTRRSRISSISDQDNEMSVATLSESENSLLASPVTMEASELETMEVVDDEELDKDNIVLPSKVELPPSSENLDLRDMPTLDVFSVYSFLRSFSTLLFLSPFELEDFVESVKSNEPTVLFDSIHVSLLRTLRKHLESLSDDSSQSASNCLRSLDWSLLDLTTWPIFSAEYLLLHSYSVRRGFDLCRLRLVESNYYKQPPSVKIEILRCLCDDLIEVEAIKSELNKRTLATELGLEYRKRRKNAMNVASNSCLTEEDDGENLDWNSDECYLCKMEGSLICCDGCPAAFHSRCVGVSSTLLPEGDWFCPECVIDKDKPWTKIGKSIRGANPLGIDAYGRLYYSSCGYLLVSEDYDVGTLVKCYHKNDLPAVIDALKSSESSYQDIIAGITNLWLESSQFGAQNDPRTQSCVTINTEILSFSPLVSGLSKSCLKVRAPDVGTACGQSVALGYTKREVTDSIDMKSEIASYTLNDGNLFASSEGSTEFSQILNVCNRSPTNSARQGDVPTRTTASTLTEMQYMSYVNYYNFAQIASAVAEDFFHKLTNKKAGAVLSVEEIISDQLKAILTRCMQFSFPSATYSSADVGREKCGWCFSCKSPDYEQECLITMIDISPPVETFTSDLLVVQSRELKEGHFVDLQCLVFYIEARLHGLLLGPWLDPHYSQLWRKSLFITSDIASLKFLLLKLESNLSPRALSEAWVKHVDSAVTMGSGIFVKINALRGPSKSGSSRKRARLSELETTTTTNSTRELSSYWWRGGRLSRALFNWRVLPRSLASKAARQAGCMKIPDLFYPDSPEFPTRSKYVAWRADVESSKSVEQLAFQARQLYANIRWEDIENTNIFAKLDKDPRNPIRSFKKATIRQKCTEGAVVKYLLDFGKRRFIPDVVKKKGCKVEEGTNEKKKFWLEECYVPLFLLKAFEEKRIARMLSKLSPGKPRDCESALNYSFKKKGFEYLFSRAEKSEYYQCGYCIEDVLIREAVTCRHCKGFFHEEHVKKPAGAISAKCRYTCHQCSGRKIVKFKPEKKKLVSENSKGAKGKISRSKWRKKTGKTKEVALQSKRKKEETMALVLRRSPRKLKCISLKNKKVKAQKRGKQGKSKRGRKKKQTSCRRKRTKFAYTYWLNGLRLTKKRNDERVKFLKDQNKVVVCGESTSLLNKPRCILCNEPEFCLWLNYVSCEICGDWFHEDAFDHRGKNMSRIIGFKCHKCLKKNTPACPHLDANRTSKEFGIDAIPTESIKTDLHLT